VFIDYACIGCSEGRREPGLRLRTRMLGGSGGVLGELWEGLGELGDIFEGVDISKNSRSTGPASVMLLIKIC